MIVADASLVVGWILKEQESVGTEQLYDRAISDGAMGPVIFEIEVANALRSNLRRNRITLARRDEAMDLLRRINVIIPLANEQAAITQIVELSDRYDLTTYDASYVALARRHRIPLGTQDAAMARAARAEGLTVLP